MQTARRAVITQNVSAMRATPTSDGEQVSQGIFGETVDVKESSGEFSLAVTPDGYSGWIRTAHIRDLDPGEHYPSPHRAAMVTPLFLPVYRDASHRSERISLLTIGTVVDVRGKETDGEFCTITLPDRSIGFVDAGSLIVPVYPSDDRLGPNLVLVARGMIGTPYLWGGRTPFGIDCSGFIQRVFWLCGKSLQRDAYLQADAPNFIPVPRNGLQSGDLVFFRSEHNPHNRAVTHVGITTGDGRILHASGELGVAATSVDDTKLAKEFVFARRYAPGDDANQR